LAPLAVVTKEEVEAQRRVVDAEREQSKKDAEADNIRNELAKRKNQRLLRATLDGPSLVSFPSLTTCHTIPPIVIHWSVGNERI
jgi:hypothetical protein